MKNTCNGCGLSDSDVVIMLSVSKEDSVSEITFDLHSALCQGLPQISEASHL